MSSSGLIYAFIVGGWAVYLVPMWLRREDELNKARQTQRYTTAIKVLSHKDSFERRYGAAEDREQAGQLPLAAGQDGPAPTAGQRTLDRVKAKEREHATAGAPVGARRGAASSGAAGSASSRAGGVGGASAAEKARRTKVALAAESAAPSGRAVSAKVEAEQEASSAAWTPAPRTSPATAHPAPGMGPRSGLRARRRRVVGFLFALTSLGAIVSADLGLDYVWAMLLPAAVLTAYIVWVRKDERARAAERARRRSVAVRAAREAERREQAARLEHAENERVREQAERLEREELTRRNIAARRRTAAARSRAERRVPTPGLPEQGDLPRAANG